MTSSRFRLAVSDSALADLRERLARTRWADGPLQGLAGEMQDFFAALS